MRNNLFSIKLIDMILFLLVGSYIVEYDYIAKSSDELNIRKGDIITEATLAEDGWLKGECRGTIGFVYILFKIFQNKIFLLVCFQKILSL